jgi:hypothetical protein
VGAVALILMVGVYLVLCSVWRDRGRDRQLDTEIARRNEHLAELSPYRDLRPASKRKAVADGIFRSRFAWDEFLQVWRS